MKSDLKETQKELENIKEIQKSEIEKVDGLICSDCIRKGHKFCYIKLSRKAGTNTNTTTSAVSSGEGKCCDVHDISSKGCDPTAVKALESQSEYQDYNINLVCSSSKASELEGDLLVAGML
jgi:hypothetical protein